MTMHNEIFEQNISALQHKKYSYIDKLVISSAHNVLYTKVKKAKTGEIVPIFSDGSSSHSVYDPKREADQLVRQTGTAGYIVFAGIGGAFHIRKCLQQKPDCICILTDAGYEAIHSLLELIDLSDILSDSRVVLLPDCTSTTLIEYIVTHYYPAIYGGFYLQVLRSWQIHNVEITMLLEHNIKTGLQKISADYSVQAHFGRLWFRNFLQNLDTLAEHQGKVPAHMTQKTALITAAGPGLEEHITRIQKKRNQYVVFATDTSYGVLIESGINPDVFISIDAQSVSLQHVMHPLKRDMTVILDLCANPGIGRVARQAGCNLIYVAGNHPLARLAASNNRLPLLETGSGTVTIAALDAAKSMGFTDVSIVGADFCYKNGKPYARGTYFDTNYGTASNRIRPAESLYTSLVFRTEVASSIASSGITYTPPILSLYAQELDSYQCMHTWSASCFSEFKVDDFLQKYINSLRQLQHDNRNIQNPVYISLMPLLAWHTTQMRYTKGNIDMVIQLALELIAGYT